VAGVDLRTQGSKNLGATNTLRVLGWRYAVPVGLFDIAKGFAPALAARHTFGETWMTAAVGAAAILGHVFSVFARFRGGKGVATATGVGLALAPAATAAAAGVWIAVLLATGWVSLASILGGATVPLWAALFQSPASIAVKLGAAIAVFLAFTHRANLRRLLDGTESRFGR
jgi:glycerol-3-phosphate acyltransferase PlsY